MTTQNLPHPGDLFFESLVESYVSKEKNPRFLRRDWLAAEVNERLSKANRRFMLLTAAPGAGKSTFMAQLAADHPPVAGKTAWLRYFIRRDQRTPLGDVGAHSFLLRIGYQLAACYPETFSQENLEIAVAQRIGIAEAGSEVVGAEVKRIVASPFYRKALSIRQEVAQNGGRVVGLRVEELAVESQLLDLSQLFTMALADPARALLTLRPDERIVILVDALDEIRYHDTQDNILKWLTNCPELPSNVRFVLTSRPPDAELLVFSEKQKPYLELLAIEPDDDHVQDDVRSYLAAFLARPAVAQEIERAGQTVEGFAGQAAAKARGNLGYLDALARAVDSTLAATDGRGRAALRELLALRDLPDELEGLYAFFLRQIKAAVARERVELVDPENGETYDKPVWPAVYAKVLGVLTVALAPLTLSQIGDLGGIAVARSDLADAVDRLRQFLGEAGDGIRLYHTTVAEFLTDASTGNKPETADLAVNPTAWHQRIITAYRGKAVSWDQVDWKSVDDYGLRYLPGHLYAMRDLANYRSEFQRLLCKSFMQAKRIRYGSHRPFAADVSLAIALAGEEAPPDLAGQIRNEMLYATLAAVSSNAPAEVLEVLALTGNARSALDMAALITDAEKRYRACYLIAQALITTGESALLVQALDQALSAQLSYLYDLMNRQQVSNNDIAAALADLAILFDQGGLLDRFFLTYYRVARDGLFNTMAILAETLAEKEQHAVARRVAEAVLRWLDQGFEANRRNQIDDLTYAAHAFVLVGEFSQAIATAERGVALIGEERDESLLIWLAPVFADARLLDRALELAGALSDVHGQDMTRAAIVKSLVRVRENDRALTLAQTIGEADKRWEALAEVSVGFAEERRFEQALQVQKSIESPVPYVRALVGVIRAMVRSNDFAAAQGALIRLDAVGSELPEPRRNILNPESIDKHFVASYLLSDIALGMATAGMADQADPLAQQALQLAVKAGLEDKSLALRCVVDAFAALGKLEACKPILPQISDPTELIGAVTATVKAMISQGLFEPAREFLSALHEAASVSAGVQTLAVAYVQASRLEEALQLVEMVPVAYNRALVMSTLTKELLARGEVQRASTLVGQALLTSEADDDKAAFFDLIPNVCALIREHNAMAAGELVDQLIAMIHRERLTNRLAEGYAAAAQALLALGDIHTAVDAINLMGRLAVTDADKLRLVLRIVGAARGSASSQIVVDLLNSVMPLIQATPAPREQSALLVEAVKALCNVARADVAFLLLRGISNRLHQALAYCDLAEAFAQAGVTEVIPELLEAALEAAKDDFAWWQYEGQQIHTYSEDLVKYFKSSADTEEQRAEGMARLATTLAALGSARDASAIAVRAETLVKQTTSLGARCKVVVALARVGMLERAETLCRSAEAQLQRIEDVAPRALAWVDVGQARLAMHQPDAARLSLENSVKLLATAPYFTRSDVIGVLLAGAPIMATWDNGKTLLDVCRAVLEVAQWWN